MTLSAEQWRSVDAFRERFERHFRGDARFAAIEREDRADRSTLATRLRVAPGLWLELVIRPAIPQLRAGILTDDRWRNEDLEDKIEESGDTMSEFVELGFSEAGLEWTAPPVEHYRDQGKYFCFSTAFEPQDLSLLDDASTLDRVVRMINGYHCAFEPVIRKATVAAAENG